MKQTKARDERGPAGFTVEELNCLQRGRIGYTVRTQSAFKKR